MPDGHFHWIKKKGVSGALRSFIGAMPVAHMFKVWKYDMSLEDK